MKRYKITAAFAGALVLTLGAAVFAACDRTPTPPPAGNTATVTYVANAPEGVQVSGETASATVEKGGQAKVSDCGYKLGNPNSFDWRFFGWTTTPDGVLDYTQEGEDDVDVFADEMITVDEDITLYAQWGRAYYLPGGDAIYYCERVNGLGKVLLEYDALTDQPKEKQGFLSVVDGRAEFTFYFDAAEGGDRVGALYSDYTAVYRDEARGFYVLKDHRTDTVGASFLYCDGYGLAIVVSGVGEMIRTDHYGVYQYDATYGEYQFIELDPATQSPKPNADNSGFEGFYFALEEAEVEGFEPPAGEGIDENAAMKGYYYVKGEESGSFLLYDNGELLTYRLDLNGYGVARLYVEEGGDPVLESEGIYKPTDKWTDVYGEWQFTPSDSADGSFKFIINMVNMGDTTLVPVFIEYNAEYAGELNASDGSGGKLTLDGYGGVQYDVNGETFDGLAVFGTKLITFYVYGEDGTVTDTLYFTADFEAHTFAMSEDGFIIDDHVLKAYTGSSKIIIIPDGVTEIADGVFSNIVRVTIPASVKKIGIHAFSGNYTLQRVTFLGEDPDIEIDWSAANDPFRWPVGTGFVIVVPEAAKEAYKEAFSAAWVAVGRPATLYTIKGSEEVSLVPEFEVDSDGTLIAYHRPEGSVATSVNITVGQTEYGGEDIEIKRIGDTAFRSADWLETVTFGASVTEIGAEAFYGCVNLKSVNFTFITYVGASAFDGCALLGSESEGKIELPAIVTIGEGAFLGCTSLKHVVLGEDIQEIRSTAFTEVATLASDVLYVEFTGGTPPTIAASSGLSSHGAFYGNVAFRFIIPDIEYAKAFWQIGSLDSYSTYLLMEAGDEAGTYMDGDVSLELEGRAIYGSGAEIWLYVIEGDTITFYGHAKGDSESYYQNGEEGYYTIEGSYSASEKTITFDYHQSSETVVHHTFTIPSEYSTYVSADEKYTVVVKTAEIAAEHWVGIPMDNWVTDITINDKPAQMKVTGNYMGKLEGFEIDGHRYTIEFTFGSAGLLEYTETEVANVELPIKNLTCSDGSTIGEIRLSSSLVYVDTVTLMDVDGNKFTWGTWSQIATFVEPNQFVMTKAWQSSKYTITVTVNAADSTFTYTWEKA